MTPSSFLKTSAVRMLLIGAATLLSTAIWAQNEAPPTAQPLPAATLPETPEILVEDYMLVPPPVTGQAYATGLSSERSNYVRGAIAFTTAYSDNVVRTTSGNPVSDASYALAPSIELDKSTSRVQYVVAYAPGFTFYQHQSDLNASDQNFSGSLTARLSPHVTLSARDLFQRSSNAFSQPDTFSDGAVTGGAQAPNFSVVAPYANRFNNVGRIDLTFQFARNEMVGVSGNFSNMQYLHGSEATGLADSGSQATSSFYSRRIANRHYVGAVYQYQRLMSYLQPGTSETQTHAVLMFYTVYPLARLSVSFFGGPQYSDTVQPSTVPQMTKWTPAAGASLGWQVQRTNFALSYSHTIAGGNGLEGAVQMDNVSGFVRQQITKTLTGDIALSYVKNDILGTVVPGASNGHSVMGSASLGQRFGKHVAVVLGYMRMNQVYTGVPTFAASPVTNRGFISLSYQFERALGR
jgi:hypothetical protein